MILCNWPHESFHSHDLSSSTWRNTRHPPSKTIVISIKINKGPFLITWSSIIMCPVSLTWVWNVAWDWVCQSSHLGSETRPKPEKSDLNPVLGPVIQPGTNDQLIGWLQVLGPNILGHKLWKLSNTNYFISFILFGAWVQIPMGLVFGTCSVSWLNLFFCTTNMTNFQQMHYPFYVVWKWLLLTGQAHVFKFESGACSAFLENKDETNFVKVTFQGMQYELPPWSISILPDCVNVVYNTGRVRKLVVNWISVFPVYILR